MSDEYPLMAFIANEGVAPKGERYDRSALVTDTVNKLYKKTEKGDFIYSSNNLETGSIGLNKYGKACISPVYSIFEPTGIADSDFLGRRLVRKDFINAMVKWRQGVIYGQWRIHESDFLKIEITVPSVEEQRKIGAYLDQLDNLITLHQRQSFSHSTPDISLSVQLIHLFYTSSWEQRKVSDLAEKTYGGGTPTTSNEAYWNGDIPWIQSSDVVDGKLLGVEPRKWITQDGLNNSAAQLIPGNSIAIITRVGVGKLAFMPYSYATSQDFLSLSKLNAEPLFTVYACYKKLQSELNAVQGTSIKGITKDELLAKNIMVPRYAEQQQIGAFFKQLDHLITLHQRKFEKLTNVKKSMLEKMFPQNGSSYPEIRFKGFTDPWEQRKFSELVQIERGGSPRPIDDFITDAPNGLNWIKIGDAPTQGNYITKTAEKIRPEGLSKTREVHPGDLILSNSMSFGKPYIMGIDGCIHDGWLLIRNTYGVFDLTFLCHLLGTPQMLSQYRSLAAGSTVNNLNKELVGNTVVTIPSITEQRVLGDYLEQLDNLITLHQRELEKLQNIKKSMLEKMFV